MFEAGKRYWAVNGDYRIRVLCVKRTRHRATFQVCEADARRYFGTKPTFTKALAKIDVPDKNGMRRECVPRLGDTHPGCDWCITDNKVGSKEKGNEP